MREGRIRIDPRDNVAVTLTGEGEIPAGHKLALSDICAGEPVIKYGQIIGRATQDIKAGEWVHTHNLRSHLDEHVEYTYQYHAEEPKRENGVFLGYPREDGQVGVRNEIFILPTVGCVNGVCRRLEKAMQSEVGEGLDGVYALTHQFGCSQLGEDAENIGKLLLAIARHPNAAFVLLVGLGCENNALAPLAETLTREGRTNFAAFNCQEVEDEEAYALPILREAAARARAMKRTEAPLSALTVGVKCGGSDGYSGLTANPTVGRISDRIVANGGASVLTEVPEMFGAEQLLMNKCESEEVFLAYRDMIERFKRSYTDLGFPVYENPSPGNKKGGITTLEEKSLGCVEKAGHTKVVDVLSYGDRVRRPGVSVLCAPGNDLVAATALAAAGCQIVLFTTGRGTPFSTFTPTLKIASNDRIAREKSGWIDFNAFGMDDEGLFDLLLATANGAYRARSEDLREIAFYKTGVTL